MSCVHVAQVDLIKKNIFLDDLLDSKSKSQLLGILEQTKNRFYKKIHRNFLREFYKRRTKHKESRISSMKVSKKGNYDFPNYCLIFGINN